MTHELKQTKTLTAKDITHLSFSRLKAFQHSPRRLKQYITEPKEQTDAMIEGRLIDCLLFTPDAFNAEFLAMPKLDRRTKAGKEEYEKYTSAALNMGVTLIDQEQVNEATALAEAVRRSPFVRKHSLVSDAFEFQKRYDFEVFQFDHIAICDAVNENAATPVIWDLKRFGGKSGAEVGFEIKRGGYDMQAAIYSHLFDSEGLECKYYLIAVDNEGNVTPYEITPEARARARNQWEYLCSRIAACSDFDAGPEFHAPDGECYLYI